MELNESILDNCEFFSMCKNDNGLWFVSTTDTVEALFAVDVSSMEAKLIGKLPQFNNRFGHALIATLGDEVIIAPYRGNNWFYIYNGNEKSFSSKELPKEYACGNESNSSFSNVYKIHGSLFFIGNVNNVIVEYDGKELVARKYRIPYSLSPDECSFFWNAGYVVDGNIIVLSIADGKSLLMINTDKSEAEVIEIEENGGLLSVTELENRKSMLLLSYGNRAVFYDEKENKGTDILFPISDDLSIPFIGFANKGKKGFFLPGTADSIYAVDLQGDLKPIQMYELNKAVCGATDRKVLSFLSNEKDDSIFLLTNDRRFLVIRNSGITECVIKWPIERYHLLDKSRDCIHHEGVDMSLHSFIKNSI